MSFLCTRVCAALALMAAAAPLAPAATNLFVLPQSGQGSQISVLNANPFENAVTFAVPNLSDPTFIFLNPAGTRAYVLGRSGTVVVLDAVANYTEITRFSLTAQVHAATLTPDGSKLLVLAGSLRIIDISNEVPPGAPEVNVGIAPDDIAVSHNSRIAYITSSTGRTLTAVSLATNQIIDTETLPSTPGGVAVGPNGLVYVAASGALFEVDGDDGIVFTLPDGIPFMGDPGKPYFTPDGQRVFMMSRQTGVATTVYLANLNNRTVASETGPVHLTNPVIASDSRAYAVGEDGTVYTIPIDPLQPPTLTPLGAPSGTVGIAVSDEVPTARYFFAQTISSAYRIDTLQTTISPPLATISSAASISYQATPSSGVASLRPAMLTVPVAPGALSYPIAVRALDAAGRPAADVDIQYSTTASGITFSSPTARTNSKGLASVRATMPGAAGNYVIQAASGSTSIDITIRVSASAGTDSQFTVAGGQGQAIASGSNASFQVRVRDSLGNPVAGAAIGWTLVEGPGATLLTSETVTDSDGLAQGTIQTENFIATASEQFRPFHVEAAVTSAGFTGTASFHGVSLGQNIPSLSVQIGTTLNETGGTYQLPAGSQIPRAFEARIFTNPIGMTGVPVPNVGITASVSGTSGGPQVSCAGSSLSDGTGVAYCDLAVGPTLGTARMDIIVGGRVENTYPYNIRVVPGAPAAVVVIQGDGQSGPQGTTTPQALVVEVRDNQGNPLQNVELGWSIGAGSATLVNPRDRTDNAGRASAQVTFGNVPGPVTVLAAAGALSATFNLANTTPVGLLTIAGGDGQNAPIDSTFAVPLTVRLVSASGQPVGGTLVTYSVVDGPVILDTPEATTDSAGMAGVVVRAGPTIGPASVLASIGGASVTFHLTVTERLPRIDALVNGASFLPGAPPCSVAVIRGANFAPEVNGVVTPPGGQLALLPFELSGVSVQFNSIAAPIYYVSNVAGVEQVSVQVPCELPPGQATVSVKSTIGTTEYQAVIPHTTPGIFETTFNPEVLQGVVLRPDGSYISPTNPARWGETVTGFFTGLGPMDPVAGTNTFGLGQTVDTSRIIVGVGGHGLPVVSASYAANLIGVYSVQFTILDIAGEGDALPYAIAVRDDQGELVYGKYTTLPVRAQ